MSDNPTKSILFVKKADAKKANLWHEFANRRIIKQHGGLDIPEGDLHAIPKFQSPVDPQPSSPEDTKEVLSDLEKEIHQLKEKDSVASLPSPTSQTPNEQYDEEPLQHYEEQEDDEV